MSNHQSDMDWIFLWILEESQGRSNQHGTRHLALRMSISSQSSPSLRLRKGKDHHEGRDRPNSDCRSSGKICGVPVAEAQLGDGQFPDYESDQDVRERRISLFSNALPRGHLDAYRRKRKMQVLYSLVLPPPSFEFTKMIQFVTL
jgi:hypothetical protein